MILKVTDDKNEIEGYTIIKQYKYLGIDNNMKINYLKVLLIKTQRIFYKKLCVKLKIFQC